MQSPEIDLILCPRVSQRHLSLFECSHALLQLSLTCVASLHSTLKDPRFPADPFFLLFFSSLCQRPQLLHLMAKHQQIELQSLPLDDAIRFKPHEFNPVEAYRSSQLRQARAMLTGDSSNTPVAAKSTDKKFSIDFQGQHPLYPTAKQLRASQRARKAADENSDSDVEDDAAEVSQSDDEAQSSMLKTAPRHSCAFLFWRISTLS